MKDNLRTYLEWRFRVNNVNKYQRFRDEWIKNINDTQCIYFEKKMHNLIERGIYH